MGNKHGSNWIRREKRLAIYLRDGAECAYCGLTLGECLESGVNMSLDHIIPREDPNSTNHATNLVTACEVCNSTRDNQPVSVFYPNVEDIIAKSSKPLTRYIIAARHIWYDMTDKDWQKCLEYVAGAKSQLTGDKVDRPVKIGLLDTLG